MIDHYIQKRIVHTLSFHDALRFSELKPDDIESKLFTYHLKKVVAAGLIEKNNDGLYALTSDGRKLGFNSFGSQQFLIQAAYSVLFVAIQRPGDGAWLFGRRKTHPLKNKVGFMTALPSSDESIVASAQSVVLQKTGLSVELNALGGGFFRFIENSVVESFTNFTLLVATSVSGTLVQNDDTIEYFWEVNPDFSDPSFLASSADLCDRAKQQKPFHVDQTYRS